MSRLTPAAAPKKKKRGNLAAAAFMFVNLKD